MVATNGGSLAAGPAPGAQFVDARGYRGCILLENATTRVLLEPNCGGRVIEYSCDGKNAIYVDPKHDGFVYDGTKEIDPCGGRCDIGPECTNPKRLNLWLGRWTGEIRGPRQARLTSLPDGATGVQLVRDFELAATGAHVRFTQTIRNVSTETREYCHWSRTLAAGNGIVVVPVTTPSRFPCKYVAYETPGIAISPQDPQIRERDGFIEVLGQPKWYKLGFDSAAGWLAYLVPNDLMFVKRFPVYPERVYNEVAGLTISIYYYDKPEASMCELEPIGPRERLRPGESASFTEDWWLLPYPFPKDRQALDLKALADFAGRNAK